MGCLFSKEEKGEGTEAVQQPVATTSRSPSVTGLLPTGPTPSPGGVGRGQAGVATLAQRGRAPSTYALVHEQVMREKLGRGSGLVGLVNLGNTCFMNTGVQCLSNSVPLADYFLGYDWASEINKNNIMGHRGEVAKSFAKMLEVLWSGNPTQPAFSPTEFKSVIARCNPMFGGYQQHDCQELLTFLLDGLHEDLNRVKKKPYVEDAEDDGKRPQEIVAATAWKGYLQRNKSIIVDLFQGQLRSTLECSRCRYKRVKFDPFMYLSLPLPTNRANVSVEDCLLLFTEEEVLEGDEAWYCPRCKTHVRATKKLDLWKLPPVLILQLKRFEFRGGGRPRKIDTPVRFPLTDLDLSGHRTCPLLFD